MSHLWPPSAVEALKQLHADGVKIAVMTARLSEMLGRPLTERALMKKCWGLGLKRRYNAAWTPEILAHAVALCNGGMSYEQIAVALVVKFAAHNMPFSDMILRQESSPYDAHAQSGPESSSTSMGTRSMGKSHMIASASWYACFRPGVY